MRGSSWEKSCNLGWMWGLTVEDPGGGGLLSWATSDTANQRHGNC